RGERPGRLRAGRHGAGPARRGHRRGAGPGRRRPGGGGARRRGRRPPARGRAPHGVRGPAARGGAHPRPGGHGRRPRHRRGPGRPRARPRGRRRPPPRALRRGPGRLAPPAGDGPRVVSAPATTARAAVGMGAIAAISRVIGFVRVLVVAGVLGTTYLGNAFQAANSFSNVLFELLAAGALSAVLVPAF